MEHFWSGFEKQALMDDRRKEDLAVAGTSILPFGTTAHTIGSHGGDKGKEWLARMGGGLAGSAIGALPGQLAKKPGLRALGSLAGIAGGEVAASRLVHGHKYDEKGKLKKQWQMSPKK